EIAAAMIERLDLGSLVGERLEIDHGEVAALLELLTLVEDEGDAAAHARREIRAGLAEHHDDAASHVFAAMRAGAFDDRDRAGIAHRETLAGDAAEIALAGDRAVEHGVADDDRSVALDLAFLRRIDDEAAAGEALADIVVAGAFELEGDATRE